MKSVKLFLLTLLIFSLAQGTFAAETVDFYATVSSSSDSNMIKMTTDLFYTQFQGISGYTIIDKRDRNYSSENRVSTNVSFYAEIQEEENGQWTCTLNAIKSSANKNITLTKTYDTYYKILLDAKPSLENLLVNLNAGKSSKEETVMQNQAKDKEPRGPNILDSIAGTWGGEDYIEKIMLLRGGRGFVVFKNGASMNITVTARGNEITVRQQGSPNASFFPELSRETALKNAMTASPIEWTLTLKDNTLSGVKSTLVQDQDSETGVSQGTVNVTWTKR